MDPKCPQLLQVIKTAATLIISSNSTICIFLMILPLSKLSNTQLTRMPKSHQSVMIVILKSVGLETKTFSTLTHQLPLSAQRTLWSNFHTRKQKLHLWRQLTRAKPCETSLSNTNQFLAKITRSESYWRRFKVLIYNWLFSLLQSCTTSVRFLQEAVQIHRIKCWLRVKIYGLQLFTQTPR